MSEAQLRDRIEYLEAENANLRDELGRNQSDQLIATIRGTFRVMPMPARILAVLLDGRQHSNRSIIDTIWGDDDDAPEDKVLRVHVVALRKVLTPHGINVSNIWGYGYQIAIGDCAKVKAILGIEAKP